MQEHRSGGAPERRDQPAVHERPVRERQSHVLGPHHCPHEQQGERGDGGEKHEVGERAVGIGGVGRRPTAAEADRGHGHEYDVGHEQQGHGEVRRDPPRVEVGLHHDAAQHGLREDQRHREGGRPHDGAVRVPVARIWQRANEDAHDQVVAVLTGRKQGAVTTDDGKVVLNLKPSRRRSPSSSATSASAYRRTSTSRGSTAVRPDRLRRPRVGPELPRLPTSSRGSCR